MGVLENRSDDIRERIVQEMVPGKQITLAHIVANPDNDLYVKLGLNPAVDYSHTAIGIMTVCPSETTIIMADIAIKAAGVKLGFIDRFTGTLIITGSVSEVEAAMRAVLAYAGETLGFTHFPMTRT